MGRSYFLLGEFDEAIASCREVVKALPKSSEAHNRLGVALQKNGQYQESIEAYREAHRLSPNSAIILNSLSWSLATCPDIKLRDPAQAVEHAEWAVLLEPSEAAYWNTLGVARYRMGDWKAAIADLKTSMDLRKSGDAGDWFFLAMSHWQLGDKKLAAQFYQQAVEWMDKRAPRDEEMLRFRTEAANLLGVLAPLPRPVR